MKKLIAVLMLTTAFSANAAVDPVALVYILGIAVGTQVGKEVPFHLTDACKVKMLKMPNSNISYASYEHCLK